MAIRFNEKQTGISEEEFNELPVDIQDRFMDLIESVPFIRWMVSPDRPRAKDLPRDDKGRIIVDVTKPHILEDMDYFRPMALYWNKHHCYTKLKPNGNPNSEYMKLWNREIDRIWNGMTRESDGEWIPGILYFYWNYSRIMFNETIEGSKKLNRHEDWPEAWDSTYIWAHYINQAMYGGKFNNWEGGEHFGVIARRGIGKSFFFGSLITRAFMCGENSIVRDKVKTFVFAYDKQYLNVDGTLNKFMDMFEFLAKETQFPHLLLTDQDSYMHWKLGYETKDKREHGLLNEVSGLSVKDQPDKVRGKRGVYTLYEEFGCFKPGTKVLMYDGSIKNVEDIVIGDEVMGEDNTPRNVLQLYNGTDKMYKVTLSNGDYHVVNSKHLIDFVKYNWYNDTYVPMLKTPEETMQIKDLNKGHYINKSSRIEFTHKDVTLDPYLLGLWLGDGDKSGSRLANGDVEVIEWLRNHCAEKGWSIKESPREYTEKCIAISISNGFKREGGMLQELRKYNLLFNKHIPNDYIINDRHVQLKLLAGLLDTDGDLRQEKKFFELMQAEDHRQIMEALKFICDSLGFKTSIGVKETKHQKMLRLRISGHIEQIPTRIKRRQYIPHSSERNRRNWNEYTFKVEPVGVGKYYGFLVDGNHRFLLSDFTIVHNCFPGFLNTFNTARYNAEEGDYSFGSMGVIGTGGTKGNNFSGALQMIYHPSGFKMYAVPNVFDKSKGKVGESIMFLGAYMNRKGCYDKDGNSDVSKAILQVLWRVYKIRQSTTDPATVTQAKAEEPLTIEDAIMKTEKNIYPVSDLNSRIQELRMDPHALDDVYVGKLNIVGGQVEFEKTTDHPIRDFPLGDNKAEGALEIFMMPEKDNKTGRPIEGRYLIGADVFDNDVADSLSLGSVMVLDAFTDRLVAEYTGRPQYASEFYEICRRLCLFYNAKICYENNFKGLYAYFSQYHSTWMLTPMFQYLRDEDRFKGETFGNTAYGVRATTPIRNYSRGLIREWLLKPRTKTIKEGDVEIEETYPQLMDIKNVALLKELAQYDTEGNFDRHDALAMLMLYREDVYRVNEGDPNRMSKRPENKILQSKFFTEYQRKKDALNRNKMHNNTMLM